MKKVFVLGSINMDMVISIERIPQKGETLHGKDFFTNSGGKGANQAVACAKQGVQTCLIGAVGRDIFGEGLLQTLKAYDVDTHLVQTLPTASGVAMIAIESGDNRIILDGGANMGISTAQIDRAISEASAGDLFVTQLENNEDAVHYALLSAKKKGMITVFNPAPASIQPQTIYSCVDILVVNESECRILTGITPSDAQSMKRACETVAKWGVRAFVLTLGARGSVCFTAGEEYRVEPMRVAAVDTTAAGDTFVGAMTARLAQGASLTEALDYASAASALTCCKRGAQCAIPTATEVLSKLHV